MVTDPFSLQPSTCSQQPSTFNFQRSTFNLHLSPVSSAYRPYCFYAVAFRTMDAVVKVHGRVAVRYDELEPVAKSQVIISVSYFEDPVLVAAEVIFHTGSSF